MNLYEKTINEKQIYEGNIITVKKLEVELPDKSRSGRDIVLHPGAAAVIPIDKNMDVYMVRQYRKAIERITIEIPAGKLDSINEKPLVCAKRELEEETGLKAEKYEKIAVMHSALGFCNEVLHIYLATDLKKGKQNVDDDEFLAVEKYPLKDLVKMVENYEITDSKSIIAILKAEKLLVHKIL